MAAWAVHQCPDMHAAPSNKRHQQSSQPAAAHVQHNQNLLLPHQLTPVHASTITQAVLLAPLTLTLTLTATTDQHLTDPGDQRCINMPPGAHHCSPCNSKTTASAARTSHPQKAPHSTARSSCNFVHCTSAPLSNALRHTAVRQTGHIPSSGPPGPPSCLGPLQTSACPPAPTTLCHSQTSVR